MTASKASPAPAAIKRPGAAPRDLHPLLEPLAACEGGPTLILFPPIRSGMVGYTILINALRSKANIYGLRYPGDLNPLKPDMIERLSRLYAEAIERSSFASPLVLAGWSMGALLVIEAPRRLSGTAIQVQDLVLIDPHPMEGSLRGIVPQDTLQRRRFFWLSYLSFKFHDEDRQRVLDEGRFWDLSDRERLDAVKKHDPGFSGPFREFVRPIDLRIEFKFISRSLVALSGYSVRPYSDLCTIVCCKQFEARTKAAWTTRDIPNRRIIAVDGDHNSIMLHHCIEPVKRLLLSGGDATAGIDPRAVSSARLASRGASR